MLIFYIKLCIVKFHQRKVNKLSRKCDNCRKSPKYIIDDFGARVQHFCEEHLPVIYKNRAKLNLLKLWGEPSVEAVVEAVEVVEEAVAEEVPTKKSKKKAVAEAVVDEAVVEEVPVEEPVLEAVVEDEPNNQDSN